MVTALLITLAVMIAAEVVLERYCEGSDFLSFENIFVQRSARIIIVLCCCILLVLPFLGDWSGVVNAPRFFTAFVMFIVLLAASVMWWLAVWCLLWLGEKLIQCLQAFWQWIWGE